ncbi:LuxR C-terminal-related transcriptional regulator [Flavivirga spongiicola]|uniref:LuxR C-terminal-related transcriptional regulator n=1 Tax=Flavivirga spongiicola TaxID=421621 RepID=UPI0026E04E61|nr:LuxR C-terminal-related transcriptional regulator [Flavivirga sp. MEBiC05379]MDO5978676.1 LuxR C-terminal-related transcriptional regulator [Flavivirga sp. MEBiC05379]
MNDKDYFSHLYEIASHLNKEFSLHSALRKSLEKTVEILDIETGWFWLTEPDNKSVYLAASYNLPPALSNHPERLSGWCYCIKQYLADDIDQAMNISEITCSRLKDISTGTKGLKFHAIIPIIINRQKVGLMNLLSKETRELNEKELAILNTISELIGTAIQRTRLQQSYNSKDIESDKIVHRVLEQVFNPNIEAIISCLDNPNINKNKIKEALNKAKELQKQLTMLSKETREQKRTEINTKELLYPELPLTKRELEVLTLIKKGLTNGQIGKQLFIAERTVKFHVTAILSKLNANTRTEAVDICLKRGFLNT